MSDRQLGNDVKEVESHLRDYLDQEELNELKKLHRKLDKRVTYKADLQEKSHEYAIVSYELKGKMIPSDAKSLKWFANALETQIDSAEVNREVMRHERLRVTYHS